MYELPITSGSALVHHMESIRGETIHRHSYCTHVPSNPQTIHIDCTHEPSNPQTKRAWQSVQYRTTPEMVSTGSLLLLRIMSALETHLRSRGRGSTTVDCTPLKLTNSNDSSPLPPATSRTPVPCLPIRKKSTRKLPHADMAKVANTHCCILPRLDQRRRNLSTFGRHHSE